MQSETRNCQNCKQDFVIDSEDFKFYEKIKVPPPTFCPECRKQRRLSFRNTHALYRRKDSFSGKDIISIYSSDKNLCVIDQKEWWRDGWDALSYGKEYDFSKPFFEQWKELRNKIPLQNLSNSKAINSDYCNVAEESKDCYLISASWGNERTMYSDAITSIKDSLDLHVVHRTEFSYDDVSCSDSYQLFYSQESHACTDSYFLFDCRNCINCFMCFNLRNKNYCMYNEQLTKEEYYKRLNEMKLQSYKFILEKKKEFENLKQKAIHRFAHIVNSQNVSGDNIENAKNCHYCYDITGGTKDCKYLFWGGMKTNDVYDSGPGIGEGDLIYEAFDGAVNGSRNFFTSVVYNSKDIEYSFNCYNSSDLFGCIALRNKQYCILNKQYSKEDYFSLLKQIKEHMNNLPYKDKLGNIYKYGEFFPIELSPFCYNETVAQDYFPLTKEECLKLGYSWKDPEERNYVITKTSEKVPDSLEEIEDSIVHEIIECVHKGKCKDRCTEAFRILPDELTFYKRFSIPIPRLCYGCRHYERLRKRKPMKLWKRNCMCDKEHPHHKGKCEIEFETSYAPDRPEIVYCEKCYQAEIY